MPLFTPMSASIKEAYCLNKKFVALILIISGQFFFFYKKHELIYLFIYLFFPVWLHFLSHILKSYIVVVI